MTRFVYSTIAVLLLGIALPGLARSPMPTSRAGGKAAAPSDSFINQMSPAKRAADPSLKAAPTTDNRGNGRKILTAAGQPATARPVSAGTQALAYGAGWHSFNGGGTTGSSSGFALSSSFGQTVTMSGSSTTGFALGGGFWYGSGGCSCRHQGDMSNDGIWDAVDMGSVIDVVFFGGGDVRDQNCSTTRSDVDCSGATDAIDMGYMIDLIFFGGPVPCNPCAP